MYDNSDCITSWLQNIVSSSSTIDAPEASVKPTFDESLQPRKRRKISHPMSPPRSESTSESSSQHHGMGITTTPSGKRPREPHDTPAPPTVLRRRPPPPSLSASHSASRTGSQASGYSSPSKDFSGLELDPEGVQTKVLRIGADDMPLELSNLLIEMEEIGRGLGVVPLSLRPEIDKLKATNKAFQIFRPFVFEELPGLETDPPPSSNSAFLDTVQDIVAESMDCQLQNQVESGWNNLVHTPLIKAALTNPQRIRGIRVAPCMTAKIIREYLPVTQFGKMVDYVLSIDPLQDKSRALISEAIDDLRRRMPLGTVNHTDFDALRNRPIAVSIETKRRGERGIKAEAQISTWHAAQWKFLTQLAGDRISTLPFIPAMIVIGDEWKFVASTQLGGKTAMWFDCTIGSTSSELGVFQVIAGLRRLAKWSAEVYWPWYKREVLGILEQSA